MATAFSVLGNCVSKCRQRCSFEASFGSSSIINCKRNNLRSLRNYFRSGMCFIRHFSRKSFPWTQSTTDIYPRDPFLHRLCGSVLLYRVLKNVPDGHLHPKEFLKSVKDCILLISELVHQMDPENRLTDLLGSRLDKVFKDAFATVFDHQLNVNLEVSAVSNLHISAVRTVLGPLEPSSDCYAMDTLGQQIFIRPEDTENLDQDLESIPSREGIMKIARRTVDRGYRIQIGVKFLAKEKFYITGSDGEILNGSKNSVSSHYMWLFESPFDWNKLLKKEYPLSWRVVDIDKHVQSILPKYQPFSSMFKD